MGTRGGETQETERESLTPAKQYEIPPVLFSSSSIFRAALFRSQVCSLYHSVGLFSLSVKDQLYLKC